MALVCWSTQRRALRPVSTAWAAGLQSVQVRGGMPCREASSPGPADPCRPLLTSADPCRGPANPYHGPATALLTPAMAQPTPADPCRGPITPAVALHSQTAQVAVCVLRLPTAHCPPLIAWEGPQAEETLEKGSLPSQGPTWRDPISSPGRGSDGRARVDDLDPQSH